MKKFFFYLFFVFSFIPVLFAQSPSIRLGLLKGISCVPCAYLIENKNKLAVQNISFTLFDSAQSELPKLLRGQLDLCFLAPENAAKVFEKTKGAITVLGVVQNGNLSLLTNDENYASLENLKGKTVLCSPEDSELPLFKIILSTKGLEITEKNLGNKENTESSITIDFSVPTANIANSLIQKKAEFALLQEPYASVALKYSDNIRRAENIQKLYNESENFSVYPTLLLVARSSFVKNNRDLLRRFIDVYKSSIQWTSKNPDKAALLAEKYHLSPNSSIIRFALPNAALVWRDAGSAKGDIEKYLTVLIQEKMSSAPENLPTEEFYF